ncbi:helix-turn-helix domain-containing protein [Streptomyces vinaceus]|uniref:helix-turn-helix domain-containing protein n=1 Tax=Streptomyces vinaceus TaxID=1960 RepID=UPI0038095CF8
MSRDWKRLGEAIEAARDALGMSQVGLAEAAGISESTVQNYEAGVVRVRTPVTLAQVERALGWEPGSGAAVLAGGDPTPTAPAKPELNLPLRVTQALSDGQLIDTKILELNDKSGAKMIVVVKGRPNASPEEIQAALDAWERAEDRLRDVAHDAE